MLNNGIPSSATPKVTLSAAVSAAVVSDNEWRTSLTIRNVGSNGCTLHLNEATGTDASDANSQIELNANDAYTWDANNLFRGAVTGISASGTTLRVSELETQA